MKKIKFISYCIGLFSIVPLLSMSPPEVSLPEPEVRQEEFIVHNLSQNCTIYARLYNNKLQAISRPIEIDTEGQGILLGDIGEGVEKTEEEFELIESSAVEHIYIALDINELPDQLHQKQPGWTSYLWREGERENVKQVKVGALRDKNIFVFIKLPIETFKFVEECSNAELIVITTLKEERRGLVVNNDSENELYYAQYVCKRRTDLIHQPVECTRMGKIEKLDKKTVIKDLKLEKDPTVESYLIFARKEEDLPKERNLDDSSLVKMVRGSKRLPYHAFFNLSIPVSEITVYDNIHGIWVWYGYGQYIADVGVKALMPQQLSLAALGSIGGYQGLSIILRKLVERMQKHKNRERIARVRQGAGVAREEKEYIASRKNQVEQAMAALLGKTYRQYPVVGLCMSGGGYRAMISSLGFMLGLNEIGVLGATTYMAGLSGSTWMMVKYLLENDEQELIENIQNNVGNKKRQRLELNFEWPVKVATKSIAYPTHQNDISRLISIFTPRYIYKQHSDLIGANIIEVYGGLLAHNLLKPSNYEIGLSELWQNRKRDFPFPIFTAITSDEKWVEFTPYEVGSYDLKSFIPTWALGRRYIKGISIDDSPEMAVPYLMGLWGSAIALHTEKDYVKFIQPVIDELLPNFKQVANLLTQETEKRAFPITEKIIGGIEKKIKGKEREIEGFISQLKRGDIQVPFVPNWLYDIKSDNPLLQKANYLLLRDAGIAFNLPFPPLLRPERGVNVIIVWDASKDLLEKGAKSLQQAEEYAKKRDLIFPEVTAQHIERSKTENYLVIGDPKEANTLTIIYMSLAQKKPKEMEEGKGKEREREDERLLKQGYTNTFNFYYTKENFNELVNFAMNLVKEHKQDIIDVLRVKTEALSLVAEGRPRPSVPLEVLDGQGEDEFFLINLPEETGEELGEEEELPPLETPTSPQQRRHTRDEKGKEGEAS